MYPEKPLVIYSKNHDGRHWLTTLEFPPLQIAPVAANHCRVAYFLATLISSKLITYENNIPMTLSLTRNDVAASRVLAESFPEQIDHGSITDELKIRLVFEDAASQHENDIGRNQELFLTPRPMLDWQGSYDEWIYTLARQLGINAPEPADEEHYYVALNTAIQTVREKIPNIRDLFLEGTNEWKLRLKVGLLNNSGELSYVWLRPMDWSVVDQVVCEIESEPYDCDDFWVGRVLRVPVSNLVDYSISTQDAHCIDAGQTRIVDEDYGWHIIHH